MADQVVPIVVLSGKAETAVAAAASPASLTSSNDGTVVPGRHMILVVTESANSADVTVTFKAGAQGPARTATVTKNTTRFIPLDDGSFFLKADGLIHVGVSTACSAYVFVR